MRRLLAVALALLAVAGTLPIVAPTRIAAQDAAQSGPQRAVPWLRLDPDCLPTENDPRVRVLGSGFEPGTVVDIMVLEPQPSLLSAALEAVVDAPRARTAQSLPVVASGDVDALGTFSTSFQLQSGGLFGEYEIRARTRGGGPQRNEVHGAALRRDAHRQHRLPRRRQAATRPTVSWSAARATSLETARSTSRSGTRTATGEARSGSDV